MNQSENPVAALSVGGALKAETSLSHPFLAALAVAILLLLSGCATERYLSVEEDQKMRAACEAKGCVTVPLDVWGKIEEMLRRRQGIAI